MAHQMEDLIDTRGEQIELIHGLMRDLNSMTQDIRQQTDLQGSKLAKVDEELGEAAMNVEHANEQLEENVERNQSSNKCLIWSIVIVLIAVGGLIFFGFFKDDTVKI